MKYPCPGLGSIWNSIKYVIHTSAGLNLGTLVTLVGVCATFSFFGRLFLLVFFSGFTPFDSKWSFSGMKNSFILFYCSYYFYLFIIFDLWSLVYFYLLFSLFLFCLIFFFHPRFVFFFFLFLWKCVEIPNKEAKCLIF